MPAWLAPMLASAAVGAGQSALNNWMSKDGEQGYDMPMLTNSPYDATNMQLMAQMGQQGAINSQAGRLDPGAQILLEQIRKRQQAELDRQYFGDPGQRGGSMMDMAMSAGSMSGVGPKGLNKSILPRVMNDYASRNSQIMNYIDSLEFSGLQKNKEQSYNMMKGMPRSNELPYQGQVVSMNTPGQQGNLDLSGIDWVEALAKGGDKNKTDGTGSPYTYDHPIGPVQSQYDTWAPVAGGGYVAGNQQQVTPQALPALPAQYQAPGSNIPQNYDWMKIPQYDLPIGGM